MEFICRVLIPDTDIGLDVFKCDCGFVVAFEPKYCHENGAIMFQCPHCRCVSVAECKD